ncbi:dTDP-4-amino-4,6-dideoxygalactose transaminase [Candidatus Purcelliella pentastirinorum]|uniref:dTDP-4-amino-4,6-dideoxygalactose transaminase n=1 Tax=Candidatus Purcelliella pentastirinorum TaxID=472834 RepID=UPI00237A53E4|nr:dTDP-4-amino-4,6-dideoxygalactose transaminase [Candidatus Purcelliella pentastirinorum]WDR80585.1 dTDP-4-amino-4,6-dideoxygalactose transaminase [Candidatus Purcelliella pentastirinorum]
MILLNIPPIFGTEIKYVNSAILDIKFNNNNKFIQLCENWFESKFNFKKVFLTTSCTSSLEMAALLINVQSGDEIIMSSYTFVSTANAFVLRGAVIVFVDIRPDTLNINENLIEQAITKKTKAIVAVHYAGVSCDMDLIMSVAIKYNLYVIEDAAQGMMSKYKNVYLGGIGHIGCFSFHKTKNYTSGGEGGAIVINDDLLIKRSYIIYEEGTNRSIVNSNQINNYMWYGVGSHYFMSNLQAAYLWAQLKASKYIYNYRMNLWNNYFSELFYLSENKKLELPNIPKYCKHNAHIFYLKMKNRNKCYSLVNWLMKYKIIVSFHYVPLHTSPAAKRFSRFVNSDVYTTVESERLIRIPIYYNLTIDDQNIIIKYLKKFFIK